MMRDQNKKRKQVFLINFMQSARNQETSQDTAKLADRVCQQ